MKPCLNKASLEKTVIRQTVIAEDRVRYQVIPCEICDAKNYTWTGFSPSTSILPCQYHSTNAHEGHVVLFCVSQTQPHLLARIESSGLLRV